MGNIVNIKQLTSLAPISTEFSTMSDDYVFTHITSEPDGVPSEVWHEKHTGPMRIDGMMWLLCFEGRMELEINLTPYTLGNNSLLVTSPNSIIDVREVMHGPSDYYALFVSTAFMRDINFDLNVIGTLHQRGKPVEPVIKLSEDDVIAVRRYFDLLHHNNKSNSTGQNTYAKPIARCLIAALVYQMIDMLVTGLKDAPLNEAPQNSRRLTYVHSFMDLVHQYHRSERSVAFYADKLFISPKYLSLIIKEHTGHSAAQIIDNFVILEAKNLLRFSGKNIQQVAYELDFPNQSSFGKYFKHLTGMSPSEYQRS